MKTLVLCLIVSLTGHFASAASPKPQVVELQVTEKGFEPASVNVQPGTSVTLKVTRKVEATCATSIHIPSRKIKQDLPLNKTVTLELGKLEKSEIRFACGMNMMDGKILVQ